MRYLAPGRCRTHAEFAAHLARVAPELASEEQLGGERGPLGRSLEVLGRTLENRFAIHPMEGWDGTREGLPSELTLRRWRRFGRSGASLIWGGEAFAVREDGRANPRQLFRNPRRDVPGSLALLREEIRAGRGEVGCDPDGALIGLQLTHSGRFAQPEGAPAPRTVHRHPVLDERFAIDSVRALLSDGELEGLIEDYVESARLAREAGFDFVDVKACHGYLIHETLAAHTRPGTYGGSFENRARFFRAVVEAIRSSSPGLGLAARISLGDVFPHVAHARTGLGEPRGWTRELARDFGFGQSLENPSEIELSEGLRLVALARELGLALVNVTLGSPYYCPHVQRPATYPPSDGYLPPEDPLKGVARHVRATRAVKAAQPGLTVVGTGYSYLQEWLPHVAQHELRSGGADLVGLGRMVLAYPELPRDVLGGVELDRKRFCRTFSDCTTAPRHGLVSGCYPLDAHYRALPAAEDLARIKEAIRVRARAHGDRARQPEERT